MQSLYSNIRKVREWKGLSQQNMADSLNVSQKHYSRIETGNVDISVSMLDSIARVLDVKPQILLGLDDSKIFNSYTNNQQGGTFVAYNATEVEQIQKLYERMLEEKDKIINLLQSKNK